MLSGAIDREAPHILIWTIKACDAKLFDFVLKHRIGIERSDEKGTPLYHASSLGFDPMVKRLLNAGANVQRPEGEWNPLHIAAWMGYPTIVEHLLEAKADPNVLNKKGNTALYLASYKGNVEIVRVLLAKGAQADRADPKSIFPLLLAVHKGHIEIVKMLVDAGADLETRNFGLNPVLVAIHYDRERILDLLIKCGATPNPAIGNDLAIHWAVRKGRRGILTTLLDNGVAVDTPHGQGYEALHIAAARGNDDLIPTLLSRSAQVDCKTSRGWTPLFHASWNAHPVMAKKLLHAGANINAQTRSGFTALHLAAEKGDLDVVNILIDHGANPKNADASNSVLGSATMGGNVSIVKRLVDLGVDINTQSTHQYTPILTASSKKDLAIVEFLLEHGAKPDIPDYEGLMPLSMACCGGEVDIVKRLVDYGVDVNDTSKNGLTALHLAAGRGHTAIVEFLLSQGADPNIVCLENTTALSVAAWKRDPEVVSRLIGVTSDPLQIDCYGYNVIDWATTHPPTLACIPKEWKQRYKPTTDSARKAHVRRMVSSLVRSLLTSRQYSDMRFSDLGYCLLILHDSTEAEHAYQLQVADHDAAVEPLVPYNYRCRMCNRFIHGNLYICLTCPGKHLCEACMTEYKEAKGDEMEAKMTEQEKATGNEGTQEEKKKTKKKEQEKEESKESKPTDERTEEEKEKAMRGCEGHTYHGVLHRHWEGEFYWPLPRTMNNRGQTVDEWLRHVLAAYGTDLL